jgi:hypothetical protein
VDTTGEWRTMRPYRTVLEQKIKERQQTYEEFAECLARILHGMVGCS